VINKQLPKAGSDWNTIKEPAIGFALYVMNYNMVNTPLLFSLKGEAEFDLGNIRLVPKQVDAAPEALKCGDLK
jgi:beta-glucosidase